MNKFEEGLLSHISLTELRRIQSIKIGIGGVGGLGSNVAAILVRSGFKQLEIIDFDNIEAANLNRQHYFINDIGNSKVLTLKRYLSNINPDVQVKINQEKWERQNAKEFFGSCNYIVEALDNPQYKKDFVEFYQDKISFVISGNGMAGIHIQDEISTMRINNLFIVGDNTTDTHEGHPPMAPRVMICASKMAEIILNLALGNLF
jgi:sulfur carrier protein ThiS adenylyltransferase